jgi:hypothetical protein
MAFEYLLTMPQVILRNKKSMIPIVQMLRPVVRVPLDAHFENHAAYEEYSVKQGEKETTKQVGINHKVGAL